MALNNQLASEWHRGSHRFAGSRRNLHRHRNGRTRATALGSRLRRRRPPRGRFGRGRYGHHIPAPPGQSRTAGATVAADRCEALLKAARGDLDGALADLTKVVEQAASECPFESARSRLALGQVYRRAGYKSRANEALVAAAAALDDLGIPRSMGRTRTKRGRPSGAARVGKHPDKDPGPSCRTRRIGTVESRGRR